MTINISDNSQCDIHIHNYGTEVLSFYNGQDITKELQKAIDGLESGTIILPRGQFKVSDTINLHDGIRVFGQGRKATSLLAYMTGSCLEYLDSVRGILDDICIGNLGIMYQVTPTKGAGINLGTGPALVQAAGLQVNDVLVDKAFVGINIMHGIMCSVGKALIQNSVSHGLSIGFDNGSTTSTFIYSTYVMLSGGNGFHFDHGGYCATRACASDSNKGWGYFLNEGRGHDIHGGAEKNLLGPIKMVNCNDCREHVWKVI